MSMEAKELRIGNLVMCEGMECVVNGFDCTDVTLNHPAYELEITDFVFDLKPIPLTEEWLIKFGFVKNENWFYKKGFIIGYLSGESQLEADWKFAGVEGSWNKIEIKHVHQLQNLFFALTGKELTF